jgi:hypothetical protein
LSGMQKEQDEELLEQIDPNLQPEDEGVIRRYLHYADILLGSPEEQDQSGGQAKELPPRPEIPFRFSVSAPDPEYEKVA